jgi:hypothetical protein
VAGPAAPGSPGGARVDRRLEPGGVGRVVGRKRHRIQLPDFMNAVARVPDLEDGASVKTVPATTPLVETNVAVPRSPSSTRPCQVNEPGISPLQPFEPHAKAGVGEEVELEITPVGRSSGLERLECHAHVAAADRRRTLRRAAAAHGGARRHLFEQSAGRAGPLCETVGRQRRRQGRPARSGGQSGGSAARRARWACASWSRTIAGRNRRYLIRTARATFRG